MPEWWLGFAHGFSVGVSLMVLLHWLRGRVDRELVKLKAEQQWLDERKRARANRDDTDAS